MQLDIFSLLGLTIVLCIPFVIQNILVMKRALEVKVSSLFFLASSVILSTIVLATSIIGGGTSDFALSNLMFGITSISAACIPLSFAFFLESYAHNSYFSYRTSFYLVFTALVIALVLTGDAFSVAVMGDELYNYTIIMNSSYIWLASFVTIVLGLQAVVTFRKAYTVVPQKIKKYIFHMAFAIAIYTIDVSLAELSFDIYETFTGINLQTNLEIMTLFLVFMIGSQVYFVFSYYFLAQHPEWLQLQSIHYLLVINDAGIPLFSHRFESGHEDQFNVDEGLIGGAVSAMSSLFGEISQVDTDAAEEIRFHNFTMLMDVRPYFTAALIVSSPTVFTRSVLTSFTSDFDERYGEECKDWLGDCADFVDVHEILEKYFANV